MERLRSAPGPKDSPSEDLQPLPGTASLPELVEAVRSPRVLKSDVNALLRGLAQPLAPGESPRARADLLLSVMEAPEVGDFKGSHGRSVRTAAAQALMDLGYPYALEVPPEALDEARGEEPPLGRAPSTAGIILSVILLSTVLWPGGVLGLGLLFNPSLSDKLVGLFLLAMVGVPIPSAILGGGLRKRSLQKLGVTLMALLGAGLMAYSLTHLVLNRWFDIFLGVVLLTLGVAHALGAFLLRPPGWRSPKEGEEVPDSGTPDSEAP